MAMLRALDIKKYYGGIVNRTKAIDGLSLDVDAGEFVAIMGPSGSGKTTLLNCLATIDSVTSGQIFLEDTDITKLKGAKLADFRRHNLGFIFQDFNLLDTLTAYENIALALSIQKVDPERIDKRVRVAAKRLGIAEVLDHYPHELSGGQKQRVASARAIVTNPKLVFADEPTGALDSRSAKMLLARLAQLNEKRGATILMVTHDSVAASFASRVVFLKDGRLFHEMRRTDETRRQFYGKITRVSARLGGA